MVAYHGADHALEFAPLLFAEPERPGRLCAENDRSRLWKMAGAYALLGPSGCGKSTLLNIISGLLSPSDGRILFDGKDVTDLPPDQRNIAQVFQFPVIYDTMTVRENLAFPLQNRGVPAAKIAERVAEIAAMLEVETKCSIQRRRASLPGQ